MAFFVYKPDWYVLEDSRLDLQEFDWSKHYVSAGITVPLRCELDLVMNGSVPERHDIEDVSVELHPLN